VIYFEYHCLLHVCVSTLSYANIDRERAANKKKETDDIFFALIFWLVVVPTFHPLVVSQSSCVHHFNLTSRVASFWSRTMMIKFNMQIELVISKTANSDKDKISFFSLLKKNNWPKHNKKKLHDKKKRKRRRRRRRNE